MAEHLDNPAGRLWLFLKHVVERASAATDRNNPTFKQVFTDYFGAEDDEPLYYARISAIMQLPVDVRDRVESLTHSPLPAEMLIRPLPTVQTFLTAHAAGRHSIKGNALTITDGVLNDLEGCSHILSRSSSTARLDETKIASIRESVDSLIASINLDDSLPVTLRRIILRYAHRILVAIDEYNLRGPEAIAEANDALIGITHTNADILRRKPDIWDKIERATTIVTLALAVSTGPAQIAQAVDTYSEQRSIETPYTTEAPGPEDSVITLNEVRAEQSDA